METNKNLRGTKLEELGKVLLNAAYEYWDEYHRELGPSAVVWLKNQNGNFVLFTRGEYLGQIMQNITPLMDESHFDLHGFDSKD